jgi:hypothetical protein
MEIDGDFLRIAVEEIKPDFFRSEVYAYMALNGGYEIQFQSWLGKKIQDKVGTDYWVHTNKNSTDLLIKDLISDIFVCAIEVGHYQLQQNFSGNSKLYSDIFEKSEKFTCPVFHIFIITDISRNIATDDKITKYGSKRKESFDKYSEAYDQYQIDKKVIFGEEIKYFGFNINYRIFVCGPFLTNKII